MTKTLKYLTFALLLVIVANPLQSQLYMDMLAGIHPSLVDDSGASLHFNAAVGRQASRGVGYGLNIGAMAVVSTSTSTSFSTLGVQFRHLDRRHRFYGKLEAGSLLNMAHTTDGPFTYDYAPAFDPYGRLYLGFRFGRFTMGLNYTYISTFQESINAFDEQTRLFLPTGEFRTRDQHDVQLYFGLSLDRYPVKRRR